MEITSKLIFGAILTIIGGGATGVYLASVDIQPEQPIMESVGEAEVSAAPEALTAKPEPTPIKETEPEPTVEPTPQPTQQTQPAPAQSTREHLPGTTKEEIGREIVRHPNDALHPGEENYISTAWEYVHTWAGVCPSQQVKSVFWQGWSKLAALGAWSPSNTIEYFVEQAWGQHNQGHLSLGYLGTTLMAVGLPNTIANNRVAIKINHNTHTVSLYTPDPNNQQYVDSPQPEWVEVIDRGQAYMDSLYARYAAQCPND